MWYNMEAAGILLHHKGNFCPTEDSMDSSTCWYDVEAAGLLLLPKGVLCPAEDSMDSFTCWYDVEAAGLLLFPQGVLCPAEDSSVVQLVEWAEGEEIKLYFKKLNQIS